MHTLAYILIKCRIWRYLVSSLWLDISRSKELKIWWILIPSKIWPLCYLCLSLFKNYCICCVPKSYSKLFSMVWDWLRLPFHFMSFSIVLEKCFKFMQFSIIICYDMFSVLYGLLQDSMCHVNLGVPLDRGNWPFGSIYLLHTFDLFDAFYWANWVFRLVCFICELSMLIFVIKMLCNQD